MRKTNNKGFSMTEVIVAVTIFLILAIPILSQLVLSVKNNSKAKSSQYGINVAESEMELIKSVDLNAVAKIYEHKEETGADGNTYTRYYLPASYYEGTLGDTSFKLKEDEFLTNPYATVPLIEFVKKVPEFIQDAEGKCTFQYTEVVTNEDTASAEDQTSKDFIVEVTLDPSNYDGTDSTELSYNVSKDGAVQNLSKDNQAIIGTEMSGLDQDFRDEFWKAATQSSPWKFTAQEEYICKQTNVVPTRFKLGTFNLHRTTYITVAKNTDTSPGSEGEYVVSVTYLYKGSMTIGTNLYEKETPYPYKFYFNTVPDVKFFYNQLVVSAMGPKPESLPDVIFDDSIVFSNELPYEEKHADGSGDSGYTYYYTDSDLYIVANLEACRGYNSARKCNISIGSSNDPTQIADGRKLNVYYTEISSDETKSIVDNLKYDGNKIEVSDSRKRVVAQDFQPIYDVTVKVSPENGKGLTTKLEGTRGQ